MLKRRNDLEGGHVVTYEYDETQDQWKEFSRKWNFEALCETLIDQKIISMAKVKITRNYNYKGKVEYEPIKREEDVYDGLLIKLDNGTEILSSYAADYVSISALEVNGVRVD
jgi:uncharacterized protein YaiL (DUF2058 family)